MLIWMKDIMVEEKMLKRWDMVGNKMRYLLCGLAWWWWYNDDDDYDDAKVEIYTYIYILSQT